MTGEYFDLRTVADGRTLFASPLRPASAGPLSTAEQIAEAVATEIVDGAREPESRIGEAALAEQFAVSRAPVREALRILETQGLVQILPRRGAQVTALTAGEVATLYEIRAFLLGMAAARIVRGNPAAAEEIERSVSVLTSTADGAAPVATYVRQAFAMTLRLAALSASPQIERLMNSLSMQSRRYASLAFADQQACRKSAKLWQKLSKAIRSGDVERAELAARAIVMASLARIQSALATHS